MKKILALILLLTVVLGACVSCLTPSEDRKTTTTTTTTTTTKPIDDPIPPTCNVHVDENEDYVCDNCGIALEKPSNPPILMLALVYIML